MSEAPPLRVAVVGSGPAGFYAAGQLLASEEPRVEVDLIDRLPTPWGLVDIRQPVWDGLRVPPAAASKGTVPNFYRAAPCRRSLAGQSLLTP